MFWTAQRKENNMARKNHNEEAMVQFFLDNFDTDGEFSKENDTLEQKCLIALKDYKRCCEYDHNKKRFPLLEQRVADHLKGLPAPFCPLITDWGIEKQLKEWGVLDANATNQKVWRMVENYHLYWALWIIEKANKA
jgi:hypothetical protein